MGTVLIPLWMVCDHLIVGVRPSWWWCDTIMFILDTLCLILDNNLLLHMRRFPEPQHFYAAEWKKWDFQPSWKGPRWTLINITFVSSKNMVLVDLGFEVLKSRKIILKGLRTRPIWGKTSCWEAPDESNFWIWVWRTEYVVPVSCDQSRGEAGGGVWRWAKSAHTILEQPLKWLW